MEQELFMTRLDWVEDFTQSVLNVWRTLKLSVIEGKQCCSEWKKIVLDENSVEGKICIYKECESLDITI